MIRLLLNESLLTSRISVEAGEPLSNTRDQLVRMRHLNLVEAIAIREDLGRPPLVGYFQDVLWKLTRHCLEHRLYHGNCWGCTIRRWMSETRTEVMIE